MLIVLSRAHLLFITEFYRVPPSLTRFSRQQVEENGSLTHYRVFFRAAFCASKYETTRYNGSQFYLVFIEFLEIERFVDNNIHVFRRVRCTRLHYRVFIREVQMEKRSTGPLPSFSLPGFYLSECSKPKPNGGWGKRFLGGGGDITGFGIFFSCVSYFFSWLPRRWRCPI